ncbi:phosphogluconate dehydratase [Cedecea neteri]|uniref:Phosphogluconate dehydratase n=1 Tax=Cedecea neteri TaxID=158822 RepID=A0A2X3J1Y9_9ENTR|nr:phosphogluconate dehydratase [Cedecea neteri]
MPPHVRSLALTGNGNEWMPLGKMIDEKVVVNGIVALLATGGSTNHTHAPRGDGSCCRDHY